MRFAKESGTAVFVVGHVTKGGGIAGPKTLEHIVDTVLYFEGESTLDHRVLRATKNRFGSVDEIGVFRMTRGRARSPVANPSELFLGDRATHASGSAVTALLEGTRPVLVEIQALAAKAGFGTPQRVATGFDGRRLALLLAVLDKRAGLSFAQLDVFLNVVGGMRLQEPAGDLAVAAALASSVYDRALPPTRSSSARSGSAARSAGVAGRAAPRRGGEDGDDDGVRRRARRAAARRGIRPSACDCATVRRSSRERDRSRRSCDSRRRIFARRDAVGLRASRARDGARDVGVVIVAGGQRHARRRRRSSSSSAGSPASRCCCTACRRFRRAATSRMVVVRAAARVRRRSAAVALSVRHRPAAGLRRRARAQRVGRERAGGPARRGRASCSSTTRRGRS